MKTVHRVSRRTILSAVGATAMTAALPLPQLAFATPGAEAFVRNVGDQVLSAARAQSSSQFRSLLRQHADLRTIGLFVLGQYRRGLSSSQERQYLSAFENYIARVFLSNAAQLGGSNISVTGSQSRQDSVIVASRVEFGGGRAPIPINWRLIERGGGYKIFDVSVEGIWLAVNQRSQFQSVLSQSGGDIDALIRRISS